jgi:hypothetical protein
MNHSEAVVEHEPDGQIFAQKSLAVNSPAGIPSSPGVAKTLPSLLRYVDNDLLRRRSEYNKPPIESINCSSCGKLYFSATIKSTYFPLTCGCWMHYRCFIGHVVQQNSTLRSPRKDCCPACGTQLFAWEGIVAFTLAERTNVLMPDAKFSALEAYDDPLTSMRVVSDRTAYESDCALISAVVQLRFIDLFAPQAPPSPYVDGSPDLAACYYVILAQLDSYRCPRSSWLEYSRTGAQDGSMGFFLFGMLVALKMRGFLNEYHSKIVETEGWADFENAREGLQRRILEDVRGDAWSWGGVGSS